MRTRIEWTDVATTAAQGSSKAFILLMSRFGRDGALEMTRTAREVLHEEREGK